TRPSVLPSGRNSGEVLRVIRVRIRFWPSCTEIMALLYAPPSRLFVVGAFARFPTREIPDGIALYFPRCDRGNSRFYVRLKGTIGDACVTNRLPPGIRRPSSSLDLCLQPLRWGGDHMDDFKMIARKICVAVLVSALPSLAGVEAAGAAPNVWKSHGPGGGTINALAIDPKTSTTLYTGTSYGGVFKSTDGGGSWSTFNDGLTNLFVTALVIDPKTPVNLWAGTAGGGVFVMELE